MKLAFADRAYLAGRSGFRARAARLDRQGICQELAAKIDLAKATPVAEHGTPPAADERVFEKHTTHIAAADAEGNWVAMTQTINTTYGSKVIVPGTGVVLNNEMDDFAIAPGTPNAFGLVGAEANAVAPRQAAAIEHEPDDRARERPAGADRRRRRRADDHHAGAAGARPPPRPGLAARPRRLNSREFIISGRPTPCGSNRASIRRYNRG